MTFDELYNKVLAILPQAQIGEDNDGQLVIYTNLHMVTSNENPSVPAGEHVIVDMDTGE